MENNLLGKRYYVVMGEKYSNPWLAFERVKGTNHNIDFYYETDDFQNLGKINVDLDKDYLAEALKDLFSKHKKVNLLYSGGTDSHTILMTALRNNLTFNRILTFGKSLTGDPYFNGETGNPEIFSFMRQHCPTWEFIPNRLEWMDRIFSDPLWFQKDGGMFAYCPETHLSYLPELNIDPDEIYIVGKDKPYIIWRDGNWYAYYVHEAAYDFSDKPNFINLYTTAEYPELFVSQHKLISQYLINKNIVPTETTFIDYKYFKKHNQGSFYEYNEVLGRDHALNPQSEMRQTTGSQILNYKQLQYSVELDKLGRRDLVDNYYNVIHYLYHNFPQIQWEWPGIKPTGIPAWVYNLDTGETLPGNVIGKWMQEKP